MLVVHVKAKHPPIVLRQRVVLPMRLRVETHDHVADVTHLDLDVGHILLPIGVVDVGWGVTTRTDRRHPVINLLAEMLLEVLAQVLRQHDLVRNDHFSFRLLVLEQLRELSDI